MTDVAAESLRRIDSSNAIQDGVVMPYYVEDRKVRISIARLNGRLYAFDDLCTCNPKERCPLSGGLLTGTTVMCQCHGSRFDITTGAVVQGPAIEALPVYEVREADGNIEIRA